MENSELIKRAEDLARRCQRSGKVCATGFLSPAEQYEIQTHMGYTDCKLVFSGGTEGRERRAAFFLPEYMEEDETRSILITSHISTDLESLCDDIYMIHNGKMILHEDTDVLLDRYGLIKADPEQYAKQDKTYILKIRREPYGYACLTDQKQFYRENCPDLVVENSVLDEVIAMMIGGKDL